MNHPTKLKADKNFCVVVRMSNKKPGIIDKRVKHLRLRFQKGERRVPGSIARFVLSEMDESLPGIE
jgi:hypothetical protein